MQKDPIYTNSICTFAFTNDGKIITVKDKEGKLDTLPQLFMGYREEGCKTDYKDNIWVMTHRDDYAQRIAEFFSYHNKKDRYALINEFRIASRSYFLDVGSLTDSLANHQIEEMKNMETASYIRVHRGYYDSGVNQNNQPIINEIETRYVVLSSSIKIEPDLYPDLEAKTFEELTEKMDSNILSTKMLFGLIGEEGRIMSTFVNTLKACEKKKSSSAKK